MKKTLLFCILAFLLASGLLAKNPRGTSASFKTGTPAIQSMTTLAFTPAGILLLGDSRGARLFALDLSDNTPAGIARPLNMENFNGKLASLLGRKREEVRVHDMAVNPLSRNVYFSVSVASANVGEQGAWNPNLTTDALILLKLDASGSFSEVSLEGVRFSQTSIADAPDPEARFSRSRRLKRLYTIRDMAYIDGKIYISGLSNEEFSSAMRVVPFPFTDELSTSSIEFFHGSHGQYETSSPVNTFLKYDIGSVEHLIAAYSCTPLISVPIQQLKPGTHVKAKTIAELGAGSHPIDMISYNKEGEEYILITNSRRGLIKLSPKELQKERDGITRWTGIAGVPYKTLIDGEGMEQLDNYNSEYVLLLQRKGDGRVDLRSLAIRDL